MNKGVEVGMMGKCIVVHEGICVSGTEINTTCLAKFLLHSNQGRKNRSCVSPGKISTRPRSWKVFPGSIAQPHLWEADAENIFL